MGSREAPVSKPLQSLQSPGKNTLTKAPETSRSKRCNGAGDKESGMSFSVASL
jgi:hypothetical protein